MHDESVSIFFGFSKISFFLFLLRCPHVLSRRASIFLFLFYFCFLSDMMARLLHWCAIGACHLHKLLQTLSSFSFFFSTFVPTASLSVSWRKLSLSLGETEGLTPLAFLGHLGRAHPLSRLFFLFLLFETQAGVLQL